MTELTIHAAGEIHSDRRDELRTHLATHGVHARVLLQEADQAVACIFV
jgi:hypothetical protein